MLPLLITFGKYVTIFELLNRKLEEKKKDKEDEREKETVHRCKSKRCWANWLPRFFIYAGTIVRAQPERAFSLIQYIDLIYRACVDFPGQVWLSYDEGFHMHTAQCPNMHWDVPHDRLWLQYVTPA